MFSLKPSVLLCVLEQPRVDNSSAGAQLRTICPIGLRPADPDNCTV